LLRAVHGIGCGFAGALGNREGAVARLRNQATQEGADFVLVTSEQAPHVEGECRHNEYVINATAYRSRPTSDVSTAAPQLSRFADSIGKADAKQLELRWALRLALEGFGGREARGSSSRSVAPRPVAEGEPQPDSAHNELLIFMGRLEAWRTKRLGGPFYLGYGLDLALGEARGTRCREQLECSGDQCTCSSALGRWKGVAIKYGPALALGWKVHPGFPFVMLWLPALRAHHLVTIPTHHNRGCDAAYGSCDRATAGNLALSATFELDWPVHDMVWTERSLIAAGCGFGGGVMLLSGDLAEREHVRLLPYARFGLNLALLGL